MAQYSYSEYISVYHDVLTSGYHNICLWGLVFDMYDTRHTHDRNTFFSFAGNRMWCSPSAISRPSTLNLAHLRIALEHSTIDGLGLQEGKNLPAPCSGAPRSCTRQFSRLCSYFSIESKFYKSINPWKTIIMPPSSWSWGINIIDHPLPTMIGCAACAHQTAAAAADMHKWPVTGTQDPLPDLIKIKRSHSLPTYM